MALDLKKLGKSRDVEVESSGLRTGRRTSPAVASPQLEPRPVRRDPWHGRRSAPPAAGSGYGDFLDWASEGGLPAPSDVDLAVEMWFGSGPADEESPAPGVR